MPTYFALEPLAYGFIWSLLHAYDLKYGAELGTYRGGVSFFLLNHIPDLKLHTVDIFEQQPDHPDYKSWKYDFTDQYPEFLKRAEKYGDRLKIHKGWTHEVAHEIEDDSLEFVWIDADHEYEACKRDIEMWKPKLIPGGFLLGHDIQLPGVDKAVRECCEEPEFFWDIYCWVEQQPPRERPIKRVING